MRVPSWTIPAAMAIAGAWCGAAAAEEGVLTLATTTSAQNSGLLAHIHPDFEEKTGIRIKVIARGTGASLQLAREGNVDVILVHAPAMEAEFIAEGYGVNRQAVMYNDFVLIGSKADPAGVKGMQDVEAALKRIYVSQSLFVSRGDNSGTHVKEQSLWEASQVKLTRKETEVILKDQKTTFTVLAPPGDWYRSVGQGMGNTIHYATEKQGYTLVDRGTYNTFALDKPPRTDLVILSQGDERLQNPYSVIAVSPEMFPHVNHKAATRYIAWLTSPETQEMIGAFKVGGKVLFHPDARPATRN